MNNEMSVLLVTRLYPSDNAPYNGIQNKILFDELSKMKVHMKLFRIGGLRSIIKDIRSFRHTVNSGKYDLVQVSYGLKASLYGLLSPIPVVATYHGTDVNGVSYASRNTFLEWISLAIVAFIVRQLSRFMDGVIVRTEEMKMRLPRSVRGKVNIIPMGIDTNVFKPIPKEKARTTLGWGNETIVAFSNGNAAGIKRQDLAESAVECLKKFIPDARLQVIKDIEPALVPVYLSAADCLVITSDKEGAPNILREAIGCGLRVVSVPVGDVPEVLKKHSQSGIIVPREPALIAQGLLEVLNNPPQGLMPRTIEDISLVTTANRVHNVYASVLVQHSSKL